MAGMIQIPYGHGFVSRIEPVGPPRAYKTYTMAYPVKTHFRPASCQEVDCENYRKGWKTIVPIGSTHEELIRSLDFRRKYQYREVANDGQLVTFEFSAGQSCLKSSTHKIRLERIPNFLVRQGDFRQYGASRRHVRAEDWVEDFAGHQEKIKTALERG